MPEVLPSHDTHANQDAAATGRRLGLVAVMTGAFMVAEVIGGMLSGSLALLADAGHMLTDFASLALAWLAARIAQRPADWQRTFGFTRFSVMAAFVNGLALFAIAIWIVVEAVGRFLEPAPVIAGPMMAIAVLGLIVNLVAYRVLHSAGGHVHGDGHAGGHGPGRDLNVESAALHVLGDLLGSVAAIVAAGVIWSTGWTPIDPILSVLVVLLILGAAWRVTRRSALILLEAAPDGTDVREIAADLETLEGIADIHHVHLWSIDQRQRVITLHARLTADAKPFDARDRLRARLARRHGIGHSTIEIEPHRDGLSGENA